MIWEEAVWYDRYETGGAVIIIQNIWAQNAVKDQ